MRNKRVTKIATALNQMNKDDIYSLMLFTLYKMKENPDYLVLSELSYVLEKDNLIKFLSYFGGMTIQIPTLKDLRLVMQGLALYQYINIEGGEFADGIKAVASDEFTSDEVKDVYTKIADVVANYEFGDITK